MLQKLKVNYEIPNSKFYMKCLHHFVVDVVVVMFY